MGKERESMASRKEGRKGKTNSSRDGTGRGERGIADLQQRKDGRKRGRPMPYRGKNENGSRAKKGIQPARRKKGKHTDLSDFLFMHGDMHR